MLEFICVPPRVLAMGRALMTRTIRPFSIGCCLLFLASSRLYSADGYFDSNGVKIHYSVQGKGEAVVLVHGFTVFPLIQWDLPGITSALAKDYRVICIDCRGHGFSGKPHDPKKYGREMVDDVVRLLDHLQIKRAHIVGYSMGGFITLNMLARYPERMLSATTGGAGWTDKVDTKFLDEVADSLANGKGMGPLMNRLTPKGFPKQTEKDISKVTAMTATFNDMKALAAAFRSLRDLAFTEEILRKNEVPLLALVGDFDPLKEDVDGMKPKTRNFTEIIIPRSEHLDAFAKPEFIKNLRDFLAKHPNACCTEKKGGAPESIPKGPRRPKPRP
jgi:pimeloyl-ACP methyl ester carboxylesterase